MQPFAGSQTFSFTEGLDDELVKRFSQFCLQQKMFDRVLIRLKSQEGTRTALLNQIIASINDLEAKKVSVHMHGDLFVSGYLRMFLLGHHRTITPDSVGMIHLPVPMDKHKQLKGLDRKFIEELRNQIAVSISERTELTVGEVSLYNERILPADELLKYGIAHEVVEDFKTLVSV